MKSMLLSVASLTVSLAWIVACAPATEEVVVESAVAPTREASVGPLRMDVPEIWVQEPPANQMRVGQFALPDGHTTLAIFFFGVGGGGGVDANFERWIGEFSEIERSKTQVAERPGFKIHSVDVSGRFGGGRSGVGGDHWRLLGNVIECEGGPFFFKLTGPEASVDDAEQGYSDALASLRLGAGAE